PRLGFPQTKQVIRGQLPCWSSARVRQCSDDEEEYQAVGRNGNDTVPCCEVFAIHGDDGVTPPGIRKREAEALAPAGAAPVCCVEDRKHQSDEPELQIPAIDGIDVAAWEREPVDCKQESNRERRREKDVRGVVNVEAEPGHSFDFVPYDPMDHERRE